MKPVEGQTKLYSYLPIWFWKVECAQLVESKTNEIMRSMVKFKDSVSEDGESVEQVGFCFVEGFLEKLF